ncbi:hypothetical protein ACM14_19205 [Delftia sp. JD2]|nr:hypothetical protein ACM14_19205 [Delftia sp. JD2]
MTPIRKKALGDRLRAARRRCALSQDDVAELLGVKRQTVSAWETGVTVPTAFQVADLAAAYCASAHHLLFGAHYERVDVKALLPSAGSPGELAIPSVPLHVDEQSALMRPGVAAPPLPGVGGAAPQRQPVTWLGSIWGRSGTP